MSKKRIGGSLLATILLLATFVIAAVNVQYIQDTVQYYQYQPNAVMASFVSDSGMNDRGKFLLYASQPSLNDAESFNQRCDNTEKTAAILGCYDGQRIYIYDITDSRLAGIRPTTAAHEMLHAAYKRLGESDRQKVNALLEAEYNKLKDDKDLADRMAFYARTQPGDRDNELHSIVGTEIASVGAELETYYERYFSDRSKVIAQHERYRSVFDELSTRADTLNNRINQLEEEVKSQRATYTAEADAVQTEIATFNERANQGDFANQAAFAQERQILLAKFAYLENLRANLISVISEHNTLIAELNAIAIETDMLNRSIDSNVTPAPSL